MKSGLEWTAGGVNFGCGQLEGVESLGEAGIGFVLGLDWVCFVDFGGGIGFDWVCFGFVFFGLGKVIIFVNSFGVRGWVDFGVLGIGFVLRERVMVFGRFCA